MWEHLQRSIPPCLLPAAGSFNGVQGSLQSAFQMLAYLAGALVGQPERFPLLCAVSCCFVGVAAGLFTLFSVTSQCGRGLAGLQPRLLVATAEEEEACAA